MIFSIVKNMVTKKDYKRDIKERKTLKEGNKKK
jgi:hypothetical protein